MPIAWPGMYPVAQNLGGEMGGWMVSWDGPLPRCNPKLFSLNNWHLGGYISPVIRDLSIQLNIQVVRIESGNVRNPYRWIRNPYSWVNNPYLWVCKPIKGSVQMMIARKTDKEDMTNGLLIYLTSSSFSGLTENLLCCSRWVRLRLASVTNDMAWGLKPKGEIAPSPNIQLSIEAI